MNLEKAQSIYQELVSNSFWKEYDMKYFMKISKSFYDLQCELSVQYPRNSEVRKRNMDRTLFKRSNSHEIYVSSIYE